MTRIQPFRGWRYHLAAAGAASLNKLLTPPYDVISPAQQAAYYDRHPDNVIRIELARDEFHDNDLHNRFTRAAATLSDWQQRGVLRQEAAPAIYLLRESYTLPDGHQATRSGMIFRLRLAPWGQGILPHEHTFPAAKADRLALTIATGTQCSPIFVLYADPAGRAQEPLNATTAQRPPDGLLHDDEGVEHELWAVTDEQAVAAVADALERTTFYIADGHHRYETALNYQRWRRGGPLPDSPLPAPLSNWSAVPNFEAGSQPLPAGLHGFDYAWVYAACMDHPGVAILPTHRCIHDLPGFDVEHLLAGLGKHFQVTPVDSDEALLAGLADGGEKPGGEKPSFFRRSSVSKSVFALVVPNQPGGYLLRMRADEATTARLLADHSPTVAAVDVAALQSLVLGPLLGIPADPTELKRFVAFTPDAGEAILGARDGRYQAVFLVNPTPLAQLKSVSDAGEVMPPKATYFYPKLPAGLVINTVT
ncbi:MAG: DUF1015 domain-containing protein [Caldilineales bacterium]